MFIVQTHTRKKSIARHIRKEESMAYSKEENKPKRTVPEKDPMLDLLVKTVKTTVMKTSEKLKEDVGKIKKVNIKGEKENLKKPKRNYKAEKSNN